MRKRNGEGQIKEHGKKKTNGVRVPLPSASRKTRVDEAYRKAHK